MLYLIDVASKPGLEFRHVVIRSLNLLKRLGNLSKKFLPWAVLITHKKGQLIHKARQAVTWREMARVRAVRSGLQTWSLGTSNPTILQAQTSLVWSEKSVFSVQADVGWFTHRKLRCTTKPATENFLRFDLLT